MDEKIYQAIRRTFGYDDDADALVDRLNDLLDLEAGV